MRALTAAGIKSPAAIAVGVAVTIVFGLFALSALPIQLFPDIDRPQIGIETDWRSETPREVEAQLIEPEEEVLQGIPGLQQMESYSNTGSGYINLTFALGTDMKSTLVDVIGRLNRLPPLPLDAQKPFVQLANTRDSNATLLFVFMQKLPGNPRDVDSYESFLKDVVVPRHRGPPGRRQRGSLGHQRLGRTPDRLRSDAGGGAWHPAAKSRQSHQQCRRHLRRYDGCRPPAMAALVPRTLLGRGSARSRARMAQRQAGPSGRYRRRAYRPRQAAGLRLPERQPGAADADVFRANGANVLSTVDAVKAELQKINDGPAKRQGVDLAYSFDPSHFINQAVGMVTSDLIVGVLLAVGVLWFFMREWRATLIISSAIPICLCAVVILLQLAGRSLNVVALAGLAFATGMVLDAAIVALENILRLRERGMPAREAAQTGTDQVWGALLASTATNVAIFVPVIFLKDVEGQLFADLSLTIAFSVFVSLIVALTVVPVASVLFLKTRPKVAELAGLWHGITNYVMKLTDTPQQRKFWIACLILGSAPAHGCSRRACNICRRSSARPSTASSSIRRARPSTSPTTRSPSRILDRLQPYMTGKKQPQLLNYYIQTWTDQARMGIRRARAQRPGFSRNSRRSCARTSSAICPMPRLSRRWAAFSAASTKAAASRSISSPTTPRRCGPRRDKGYQLLTKRFPEAVVNTNPSLDYDQPQLRLLPDDRAIAEVGWTRGDVQALTQMLGEGDYVGQRYDGERQLFLIMKSQPIDTPQGLLDHAGSDAVELDGDIRPPGADADARWRRAASTASTAAAPRHQLSAAARHGARRRDERDPRRYRTADPQTVACRRNRFLRRRRRSSRQRAHQHG